MPKENLTLRHFISNNKIPHKFRGNLVHLQIVHKFHVHYKVVDLCADDLSMVFP